MSDSKATFFPNCASEKHVVSDDRHDSITGTVVSVIPRFGIVCYWKYKLFDIFPNIGNNIWI